MESARMLEKLRKELFSVAGELDQLSEPAEMGGEITLEGYGPPDSDYRLKGLDLDILIHRHHNHAAGSETVFTGEERKSGSPTAVMESSIRTARYFGYSTSWVNPYLGVTIRRVAASRLGSGVLGRAFTAYGLVEILESLTGNDFEEVKAHELMHIAYPHKSEYEIRQLTKLSLPFTPRFH